MFLAPYTAIADIDGSPLDAGFLFFGQYGKDPELFPVEVFWDADFTVPAAQPIRTRNGYPVRNGSPTKVYLKTAEHSIAIKNRNSAFILVDFFNKGWNASFVVDASGKTQQQINDSSIHSVGSVSEMLALSPGFQKRTVQVKATGAMYRYDAEKAGVNDGVYVRNGWVLIGFHDRLLATLAGINGDGTNEYTKLKALLDVASTLNRPVNICGLTIHASSVVATGDIKLIGSGGIKLFAGSNGTLLTSAYNLEIDGDIELDQNKVNNSGGTVTPESHCTIKHTGDNLILNGAKFKPSASMNISTRAKKKIICQAIEADGGQVNLYALPAATAIVQITGGEYKNAANFDNIQVLGGADVSVIGITSHDSQRSGIVVSSTTKKARIIGNLCYGNRKDYVDQGGWGIVCSINTQDVLVNSNICVGNQTGGITIDTYPEGGGNSIDSRVNAVGNIINGLYNDTYSTTGITLNDAAHAIVSSNNIYKVGQGILCTDAKFANVSGNTIQDVSNFFVQFLRSHDSSFSASNICDGCNVTGAAALRFIDTDRFKAGGNTIRNLTGAAGHVYRISGDSKDWTIDDDDCIRTVAGSGYVFHILGAGNTGGRIRRSRFKSPNVKGWDWYIASDNLAQFSTHDNELESVGINYITSGANVTAGDDTINGSRNLWAVAPAAFKSRTGQVAVIAGALKYWSGTAWT